MSVDDILVLGSLAYDIIMNIPSLFFPQFDVQPEKKAVNAALMSMDRDQRFGGTAGNISYNLGLLETPHAVVTSVGRDFIDLGYQAHFESPLRKLLLDVHDGEHTATCYIVNDIENNQISVFHEGASRLSEHLDLMSRLPNPNKYRIAINSPQNPIAMKNFVEILTKLQIPMIFDPGQVVAAFSKADLEHILPKSEFLVANEHEFGTILTTLDKDADGLLELVPKFVVTRGKDGATIYDEKEGITQIPVCRPKQIVETTGAGDGFRAGLLASLARGATLLQAVRVGSAIGSFVVETEGGQTQRYTIPEVVERYESHFNEHPVFFGTET